MCEANIFFQKAEVLASRSLIPVSITGNYYYFISHTRNILILNFIACSLQCINKYFAPLYLKYLFYLE